MFTGTESSPASSSCCQVSRRSVAATDSSSVRSMRPAQYFSTARLSSRLGPMRGDPVMVVVNGLAVMLVSFTATG